jgi:hypothetical protein
MKRLLVVSLVLGVGLMAAGIASASPAAPAATVTLAQALAATTHLDSALTPTTVARRYRQRYCRRWIRRCSRWGFAGRRCLVRRHGRCIRWGGGRRHCRHWVRRCGHWGYRWHNR